MLIKILAHRIIRGRRREGYEDSQLLRRKFDLLYSSMLKQGSDVAEYGQGSNF